MLALTVLLVQGIELFQALAELRPERDPLGHACWESMRPTPDGSGSHGTVISSLALQP